MTITEMFSVSNICANCRIRSARIGCTPIRRDSLRASTSLILSKRIPNREVNERRKESVFVGSFLGQCNEVVPSHLCQLVHLDRNADSALYTESCCVSFVT